MFNSILVTGASGFVGQALVPALRLAFPNAAIHAIATETTPNHIGCDIADAQSVKTLIKSLQPDAVINLAAISHIPTSFDKPELTWQVNLYGPLNILNALQEEGINCVFLQVGSGDCYGESFKLGQALDEDTAFKPMNPYAASKAAADIGCYSYKNRANIKILRARPFNHTAGGQSNKFVVSAFAEQIARIEAGLQTPTMYVGNLDAERCFLHLNDVIDAYIKLLKNSNYIESGSAFNIVSDKATSINDVLNYLVRSANTDIAVETDPERIRPTDIPLALGNSSKLKSATGWRCSYSLEDTLADVLNFWRNHYR